MSDHRGSREYRLAVSQSLVDKFRVGARVMTSVGRPLPHESARGHVTGEALYTDDLAGRFPGLLHAWPVTGAARPRAASSRSTPPRPSPSRASSRC